MSTTHTTDLAAAEKALTEALATYSAARQRAGLSGVGDLMANDSKVIMKFTSGTTQRATYTVNDTGYGRREYVLTDC